MFSSQKIAVDRGMSARPGHDTAMSIPAKSGLTRAKEYGLAVVVTLLALLARFLLDPYLGDRLPYETFFIAVAVTAWYGGLGASLTAVLLGAVLSNWFFTTPREAFGLIDVSAQVGYVAYFMVALAFVSVEQSLGRARRLTGAAMRDLQRELIERRRAEDALHETEGRYQATFANAAVGIAHVGLDGRWLRANDAACAIVGYSPGELVTKTCADITHPDDIGPSTTNAGRLLAGEIATYSMEKRYVKKSGETIWVHVTVSLLRDGDGAPQHFIAIIQDIDKRKSTEEALSLLYDLASTVNRADDLGLIYDKALDAILTSMQADRASILLFDDQGTMQFQAWKGLSDNYRRAVAGHSPWKRDDTDATPIVVEDVAGADIDSALKARILEEGIRALAFVPLISSGQIIGKFMVYFDRPWRVGEEDLGVAQGIAGTLTTGIQRKRNEQALRESAERLRLAVESAEIGTWDLNWITGENRWDRRCKALFGLAPEADVPYEAFLAMLHPEDRARVLATIQRSVHPSSDGSYDVEYRIVTADGRERWIRAMGRAFFEERQGERRPVRFMGTALDVTQRKQSETELRESEQRLQMALQVGEAGTWDLNLRTGRNLWSDSHFRLVGREPTPTREATSDMWQTAILDEDRDRVMAEWRRAEAARDLFRSQHRIRRHDDGHVIWVRAFGQFHYEQDRAVRFVGAVQNINDLKQAEQALRESEERLRLATEAAEVGIWEWNVATNHIRWDSQMFRIYGMAPTGNGMVPYETWSAAVLPEDLPEQERLLQETMTRRGRGVRVFRITRAKDGMVRHIEAIEAVRTNAQGQAEWVVGTNLDVTERHLAEQTILEAQGRLQQWNVELEQAVNVKTAELLHSQARLRAMATELNLAEQRERKRLATELHDHLQQTLVLGKITVGQGKQLTAAVPACLDLMMKMDDIFSEALTYTRTLVAELSPPVLREHGLSAALKWLAEYMMKYHIAVTVTVPEKDDLKLPEDQAVLLFQSVRELLINSSKYAGTGEAQVILEQGEEMVRIEVRDHGAGFDVETAAAAGTSSGGISSKFGLFSIQERMTALGGSFDLRSSPGQGTTAALCLPFANSGEWTVKCEEHIPRGGGTAPPSGYSLPIAHSTRIRVLLVDDHIMVRQGLRSVLDAYADVQLVGEAGNGEEAIRLVDRLRPAVVVMDVNMPMMDGIEATAQIKMRHPETVVIGISVNAAGENQEAMKRAGAAELMTKEAAVEQLYDVIQAACRNDNAQARRYLNTKTNLHQYGRGESPSGG